jgi:hypothetical protein
MHTTITGDMQEVIDEFENIKKGFEGDDGTSYRFNFFQHVSIPA